MNIEMVFDEAVLKFILKNNLISLTEDPDVIAELEKGKPCFLWSCSSEVGLGVTFKIHKNDDTYRITIYDLVPLD